MQHGQLAVQNKNYTAALDLFGKAEAENPKDPQIKACLGQTLCWLGMRDQGLKKLHQAGELLLKKARKSRDITLLLALAEQLQHWNDYAGAVKLYTQAVQVNGAVIRAYQMLALAHMQLNQKKPALAAGRQALKLAPNSAVLGILIATLEFADGLTVEAKTRLQKILQNPLLKAEEQFQAHKELAKVLDKLGEYDQVFNHLHASATIAPLLPDIKRQNANLVPNMLKTNQIEFDRELLGRWANTPFPADQPPPVFLLGFMRTGTTLTQEVLGAHPEVFVADETDLVSSMAQELSRLTNGQGSSALQLRQLDLAGVLHLRSFYWKRARALYGDKIGKRLLLDKTTMNTIDLGLINAIFPDAKLVFLLRDPRDVCLSCFMQIMTPTASTVHLVNWESTARFYAQVMTWWQAIKPRLCMNYIEFRYEDAVFDFEPAFRKVFDFLGLTWNPGVADFHKHAAGKYIASPSSSQVTQPLYSSSVGRWRRYATEYPAVEVYLQPFIEAFGYQQ